MPVCRFFVEYTFACDHGTDVIVRQIYVHTEIYIVAYSINTGFNYYIMSLCFEKNIE